jgi:CubicO group peptidase (beta-lactamase class C family)
MTSSLRPPRFKVRALLAAAALAAAAPAAPQKPTKASSPIVDGKLGAKLDELVLGFAKDDGGFCGVAMVGRGGAIVLGKGYGLFDAASKKAMPHDALFDWASVSKQFTAAAIVRLVELSRMKGDALAKVEPKSLVAELKKWKDLSLDDPIKRFYPNAPADKAGVTLRMLLRHVSGIEAGFKGEWKFDARSRTSLEDLVLSLPMTSKPGEAFDYSNSSYALLAAIVERVSGLSFERFCDEQLFKRAKMKTATQIGYGILDPSTKGNALDRVPKADRGVGFDGARASFHFAYGDELSWGYRGSGGFVASILDMHAWDRALRDDKFLSPKLRDELWASPITADHGKYGLGWYVDDRPPLGAYVWHSGGVAGVVTYYLRFLEADVVVALASSGAPKGDLFRLAHALAAEAKP